MTDPITRNISRPFFDKRMASKREEFKQELRGIILAYLNRLIEKKTLQPEYNKVHQSQVSLKKQQQQP